MPLGGAGLWLGGGPLIRGIHGLVLREGHVLFLEEDPGRDGLGFWLLRLPHLLVLILLQGGLLLGPGLSLEAPPNILASLSYHAGTTLAEQVLARLLHPQHLGGI